MRTFKEIFEEVADCTRRRYGNANGGVERVDIVTRVTADIYMAELHEEHEDRRKEKENEQKRICVICSGIENILSEGNTAAE